MARRELAISSFITCNICWNHISMFFNYAYINKGRDRGASCGSFVNAPGLLFVLLQRLVLITQPDDKSCVWRFYNEDLVDAPPFQDMNDTNLHVPQKIDATLETGWMSLLKSMVILSVATGAEPW